MNLMGLSNRVKGFIADLLRYSDLLGVMTFEDIDGLQVNGIRWNVMPSAAFRTIGAGYTEGTGTTEQVEETLAVLGGDVKVDRLLTIAKNVYEDPLATQMKMKAKAVAFTFNDSFISGDHAVDPDSFEGLKKRVANMPTRQTIWLDSAQNGTGTSLKVLASAANENSFIDGLQKALKYVDGATHLFCNEAVYLGFEQAFRRSGGMDTTQDQFDRVVKTYRGVPIIDVGLKSDKSTEIITTSEGTASDESSIYAVRMDTDDGLHGLQLRGTSPEAYDPLNGGEQETTPTFLRRIDWAVGLMNLSNYCIARVSGFKMAAS